MSSNFCPTWFKKHQVIIPNNQLLIDDSKKNIKRWIENGVVDYTDSLGVFDLNRKKIVECLLKNHDYNEKSEVGEYKRSIAK